MTMTPREVPPGVPESLITPQGNVPAIGIGTSQDYARLIYAAPYFTTVAIAEIIQPSVTEAVENVLPSLVPPYVDAAVLAGVQQYSVLLTGSTMSGPLFLSPLMPTADAQAATKAYVDTMLATAGIPEVPPVPSGQVWARETGQWVPISQAEGTFLPISGGSMQGNINMSGNTLTNMAAVPAMPNGAAPAQWVLNQIASVSLYQGTWDADTNVPDLTQLSVRVNGYTWIAITTSVSGVVIGAAIPGLQGMTIYNGDTIIYSTAQGTFSAIHAGGLSLPEADARYVQLAGSQMSGALLLNANASQPLQATTLQQLDAAVANTVTPDAPADGQGYLRVGVGANRWVPGMPLAGGIFTGAVTLAGPGAAGNNPVTVTQLNSAISAAQAGFMPISGGTFTGAVVLSGNATVNLNPVSLGQLNTMLGTYAPLQNPALSGVPTAPTATPATTNTTQIATCAFVQSAVGNYVPIAGGTMTGNLTLSGTAAINVGGNSSFNQSINVVNNTTTNGLAVTGNASVAGTIFANGNAIIMGTSGEIGSGSGTINITGVSGANLSNFGVFAAQATFNGTVTAGGSFNASANIQGVNGYFNGVQLLNVGATYPGIGGGNQVAFLFSGGNPFIYNGGAQEGWWALTASDRRLKSDLQPIDRDCLAAVNAIQLQQFDMSTSDENLPSRHWHVGYIAQQVREVMPDAVPDVPDDGPLGVDFRSLCAHLIGAVQQLSHEIDAVKGRLQ